MASAFNLCALVENWRVSIPAGGTEEHAVDVPDPRWYVMLETDWRTEQPLIIARSAPTTSLTQCIG